MKLAINITELKNEKGTYVAMVSWSKYDGGLVNTPSDIKYGNSEKEAYNLLEKQLIKKRNKIKII